jgi:hypothetical protein
VLAFGPKRDKRGHLRARTSWTCGVEKRQSEKRCETTMTRAATLRA